MIVSGGVNIYPQEIEDLFRLHPKVFDIAVVGLPDEEMGEKVVAVVQPAPVLIGADERESIQETLYWLSRSGFASRQPKPRLMSPTGVRSTRTTSGPTHRVRGSYFAGPAMITNKIVVELG